jgi:hypothetical protein
MKALMSLKLISPLTRFLLLGGVLELLFLLICMLVPFNTTNPINWHPVLFGHGYLRSRNHLSL